MFACCRAVYFYNYYSDIDKNYEVCVLWGLIIGSFSWPVVIPISIICGVFYGIFQSITLIHNYIYSYKNTPESVV